MAEKLPVTGHCQRRLLPGACRSPGKATDVSFGVGLSPSKKRKGRDAVDKELGLCTAPKKNAAE
jgi:hypothetical protein